MTTNTSAGRRHRALAALLCVASVFLFTLGAAKSAHAQTGLAGGFEIDGNLVSDVAGHDDWFTGPAGTGVLLGPPNCGQANPARLPAVFRRDGIVDGADTSFTQVAKNNYDISLNSAQMWVIGPITQSSPKSNLTEIYSHSRIDINTGNLWVIVGAARLATNGATNLDVEFNRAGLEIKQIAGLTRIIGDGTANGRTIGDVLINISYDNGGANPTLELRTWDGTQYVVSGTLPAGSVLTAVNNSAASVPCPVTNTIGNTNATSYDPLQFAEVAINLDLAGISPQQVCGAHSTLTVKTRQSGDINSNLGDIAIYDFHVVSPPTIATTQTNVACNGATTGAIDVTMSPPDQYTFSWVGPGGYTASTDDISGLAAGQYILKATSQTNTHTCSAIDTVTITEPAALVPSLTSKTNASCNGGSDGAIDISVAGGTTPYTYLWSNGATTQDLTGIPAGTYSVTVTDKNGCSKALSNIQITEPSGMTASVTSTKNVSCNGLSDGAIDITVGGGTTPYTFAWSNGATTEDLTGIPAGTYSVTITDKNGCTKSLTNIVIGAPDVLSASLTSKSNVSCFGKSDGAIDITLTGGTTAYTYLWSNGATSQDLSGIGQGTYSVDITDAHGCKTSLSNLQITQPDELKTSLVAITDVDCNGRSDGAIDISVTGGTTSYTYAWSNGATSQDLSGIPAGTYSVDITDAHGCTTSLSNLQVKQPDELTASLVKITNASCNGVNDGAIDISVSGGTTAYTYAWSNGATSQDLSGIPAGTYSVDITDAHGCTTSIKDLEVTQPGGLSASLVEITNVNCFGESNGAIDISVTGGTTPYTYAWSNGATSQDLSGIPAGTYSVDVTDAHGCMTSLNDLKVTQPFELGASPVKITNVSCFGLTDGAIDISVNGGTTPYTYAWSNGATSQDVSGIPAGTYAVDITDAHGCTTGLKDLQVTQPDLLKSSLDKITNVNCFGESNGAIDISVTGGTPPYTYAWSSGATSEDLSGIPAGLYKVDITDAHGCNTRLRDLPVTQPDELDASLVKITNASCSGVNDGAIDISVTGGTTPYTYAWSNGATSQDLSGIPAGTYKVDITDAHGCTTGLKDLQVTQPDLLDASLVKITNVNCFGESNGAIDISVTGGSTPYTYAWSNGATSQDLSGIPAGTYKVDITDAHGCTAGLSGLSVTEPDELKSSLDKITPVTCNGGSDGAIDITVTGGTTPYTYLWSNGATSEDLKGIKTGTYSVDITDAHGCKTGLTGLAVKEPMQLVAKLVTNKPVTCNGGTDGAIDISVTGGVTPYTFAWSNGATSEDLSGIAANSYSVNIQDANGCTTALNGILVTEPTALSAKVSSTTNVSCNGTKDGKVDITVTGGTSPYTYKWSNGATSEDLTGIPAGTYSVDINDAHGCKTSLTGIQVTQPDVLTMKTEPTDPTCAGADGTITASFTGGTTPYFVQIDQKGFVQVTGTFNVFSGLNPGTYTISGKDNHGCTVQSQQVTLNVPGCNGRILPTGTTCAQYKCDLAGGSNCGVSDLTSVCYNPKGQIINNVAPGVFFYYTAVTAPAGATTLTAFIQQTVTPSSFALFALQQDQLFVFDPSCNRIVSGVSIRAVGSQVFVTINNVTPGTKYIISVKYSASSLAGKGLPKGGKAHYDFYTYLGGVAVDKAPNGLDLVKCKGNALMAGEDTEFGLNGGVELYRPTPNPFASTMHFAYAVGDEGGKVDIAVFDIAGRKVQTLVSGQQGAGQYNVTWDGRDASGVQVRRGMYFIRSIVGDEQRTLRVTYVK